MNMIYNFFINLTELISKFFQKGGINQGEYFITLKKRIIAHKKRIAAHNTKKHTNC